MARKFGFGKKAKPAGDETAAFGAVAERVRRGGDASRAVELCREGLERFPDQLSARVTLGWALLDLSLFDEAREELEYVLKRAPDNLAAIRGLAQLHERSEGADALSLEQASEWQAEPVESPDSAVPVDSAMPEPDPSVAVREVETPAETGAEVTLGPVDVADLAAALDDLAEAEAPAHEPARLDEALAMAGLDEAVTAARPSDGQPGAVDGEAGIAAESPIVALERFLDRAKARRDKASESVA